MSLPAGTAHAHGRLRKKSRIKALESMYVDVLEGMGDGTDGYVNV